MSVRVTENFDGFMRRAGTNTTAWLQRASLLGERKAVERAPKGKTRGLTNSIGSDVQSDTAQVYASIEYAKYQEQAPYNRRFLRDALDDMVREVPDWKIG